MAVRFQRWGPWSLFALALLLQASLAVVIMPGTKNEAKCPRKLAMAMHLRRHGLCNRLRSMASAAILTEDLGLPPLMIDWEPEASCNVKMDELFQSGEGIIILDQDAVSKAALNDSLRTPFSKRGPGLGEDEEASFAVNSYSSEDWTSHNRQEEQATRFRRMLASTDAAVRALARPPASPSSSSSAPTSSGLAPPSVDHLFLHSSFAFMRPIMVHSIVHGLRARHEGSDAANGLPEQPQKDARQALQPQPQRRHRFVTVDNMAEYMEAFKSSRSVSQARQPVLPASSSASTSTTDDKEAEDLFLIHFSSDTPNALPYLPCRTYFRRKSDFYRGLVPADTVRRAVGVVWRELAATTMTTTTTTTTTTTAASGTEPETLSTTAFRRKLPRSRPIIGIHARVHDPVHDYAVVPGANGKAQFGASDASSLEGFIETAQRLQQGRPDAVVFLATNDCSGRVVSGLREALKPGTVFTAAEGISRHLASAQGKDHDEELACIARSFCPDDMKSGSGEFATSSSRGRGACDARGALTDLLLLSQADIILGSYWSSFTEEASAFHLTPLLTLALGNTLTSIPSADGGGWPDELLYFPQAARHGAAAAQESADADLLNRFGMPDSWVPQSSLTCGYPPYVNRHLTEKAKWKHYRSLALSSARGDVEMSAESASPPSSPDYDESSDYFVSDPLRSVANHAELAVFSNLQFESGICGTPTMHKVRQEWGLHGENGVPIYCITE